MDLRKPEIELKLELHLLKSWSKFNPSPIHAQIRIHSDKHENGKDAYTKIGGDLCVWMDRQCDIIIRHGVIVIDYSFWAIVIDWTDQKWNVID